jgi:uncharacterized membrane protein
MFIIQEGDNMKETHIFKSRGIGFFSGTGKELFKKTQIIFSVLFLILILPSTANAHRGAKNEVDTCRFSVGDEVIHFSAYTPTFTGGKSYCHGIPNIGLTHLVFDYEGKKLRHTTVEFEITKEPEGTRVYYHEPEKIKKGSVDAKIDFADFGAGDYLAHVTIMYKGEKLDSHLPFSIGVASEDSGLPVVIIVALVLLAIVILAMFIMSFFKNKKSNSSEK